MCAEVHVCGAEVQRNLMQRCRGAEVVQKCRGAEVQRCRSEGSDVLRRYW
jgi:hypothetical protein